MKAGWVERPLGEVCDILDRLRKPITKSDRQAGPYPYYGATGVLDHVSGYLFDEPLVLIGEDGAKWEAGAKSAFPVSGKVWVNNHAHVIRPHRREVSDEWLIYFLNASDLMPFVSGMTVPKLNQGRLREIPIPIPPLEDQQRIVAVLDEAFEGLTRARAHAEANLQNARELFESLRAAMLDPRPAGWTKQRLADCFRLKSGDNLTAKEMIAGAYPVYGGNGIAGTHNQSNLAGDSVIIGRVGALCGNARYIDNDIWLTDNAFKVVEYQFAFDHLFLAYLLNFKNLRNLARQTAQPVISNSSLADLELDFPTSVEEQAELASNLAKAEIELESLRQQYEAKLQSLDALRQSFLQKSFAGELT